MGTIMNSIIRVVIADDHVLVLDGMRQALDALPDITVIGIATSGRELLRVLEQVTPDVLLVDIEMPHGNGIDVLRSLDDPPPTLVITMHDDQGHRDQAKRAGAAGFLSKATPLVHIAASIRALHDGVDLISKDDPIERILSYREPVLSDGAERLTEREKELLRLMTSGVTSTRSLSNRMFITEKTVKNHLHSIFDKLDVTDRAQAVIQALQLGITVDTSTEPHIDPVLE
jgi:two-component system response regulator DegU